MLRVGSRSRNLPNTRMAYKMRTSATGEDFGLALWHVLNEMAAKHLSLYIRGVSNPIPVLEFLLR
jgi:hypothetical protein